MKVDATTCALCWDPPPPPYLHIAGVAPELLQHLATLQAMHSNGAIIRPTQHLYSRTQQRCNNNTWSACGVRI